MATRTNASLPPTMLLLDSKNASQTRENGSTAYFTLPEGIDTLTQSEIQSANVQLLQFQCTNSIYNISSALKNNILEIFVPLFTDFTLTTCTSSTITYTIPDGHYTTQQLVDTLNYLIATSSQSLNKTYNTILDPNNNQIPTKITNLYGNNGTQYGPYNKITNAYYPLSFGAQMLSEVYYPITNGGVTSSTASSAVSYNSQTGLISFNIPHDYNNASILTDITSSKYYSGNPNSPYSNTVATFSGMIIKDKILVTSSSLTIPTGAYILGTSSGTSVTSPTTSTNSIYYGFGLSQAQTNPINAIITAFQGFIYNNYLYTLIPLSDGAYVYDNNSVITPCGISTGYTSAINNLNVYLLGTTSQSDAGTPLINFLGYTVNASSISYLYTTQSLPSNILFKYNPLQTGQTVPISSNGITFTTYTSTRDGVTGIRTYTYTLSTYLSGPIGTISNLYSFQTIPSYLTLNTAVPALTNLTYYNDVTSYNDLSGFFKRIYSGFYVISSNGNSGLLKTMGFPIDKAFSIPNSPSYYGFGIQLQPQFSYIDQTYNITNTPATINTGFQTGFISATATNTNYILVQYIPHPSWVTAVSDCYKVLSIIQNPTTTTNALNLSTPISNINNYSYNLAASNYLNNTIYSFQPYNIMDLSYPRCVYVSISGMSTNNRSSTPQSSYGSIFACVPFDQNFGNEVIYEPKQKFYNIVPNFQLQNIQIRTIDEFGNAINWNNGSWKINIGIVWSIDLGSAGLEDVTRGRTYRPMLYNTNHDPLQTYEENQYLPQKRRR